MEDQTHNTLRPLEDIVARNEFLVSRYDHYYDSVNNKGMFYLTFNSSLLSGICGSYIALKAIINASITLHSLVIILFVTTVLSSVYTILSINPFLKKCISSSNTFSSLMFFGDVAKKSNEEFIQKTLHRSEMDHCIDLLTQTTIPWVVEWVLYYEIYLRNGGKWEGRESPSYFSEHDRNDIRVNLS